MSSNSSESSQIERAANYACAENDWDEDHHCLCRPGQAIHTLHSEFSEKHEDRKWRLGCLNKGYHYESTNNWFGKSYQNSFDRDFEWNGQPYSQFMVGMKSSHRDSKEDRQYQVFYTTTTSHTLTDCTDWQQVNSYQKDLDYSLENFEVITGLYSRHDNDEEDRKFWIKNCRLKQKAPMCGEMDSIQYEYGKAVVEQEVVSAGSGILDNTNAQSENTLTAWVTRDFAESHSETYSFARTSGHETALKLEMSTAVSTKVGLPSWLGGLDLTITATVTSGVTTTWSESQTWTRTESKEYSETNGNKFQFITNCKPGYICKANILVKSAIASIPYALTTRTDGTNERCVEYGTLTMAKTFNGQMMVNDTRMYYVYFQKADFGLIGFPLIILGAFNICRALIFA